LSIPQAGLGYWIERLAQYGVRHEQPVRRFAEQVLAFRDPDGLPLELVACADPDPRPGWREGPLPAEHAIRGVHAVALWEEKHEPTAKLLTEEMGFHLIGQEGNVFRYAVAGEVSGALVDVRHMPGAGAGAVAVGTVHHVAWRTPNDEEQLAWRRRLVEAGLSVTPVQDRKYFRSIYFREPGRVLFEIATDPPGFAVDEPVEQLGSRLRLPPWLESRRAFLERVLPPLRLPQRP
jgi:catechol 2,3-dioxygenase-like lactoylglutathione lyase family enzyme